MDLLTVARGPLIVVTPEDTVMHAIEETLPPRVGAVAVMEGGRLAGIFTERDVMVKIVHGRRDPLTTKVGEVMTSPVITVPPDTAPKRVLRMMLNTHIRHLPIATDESNVLGMLSIRDLMAYIVEDLTKDLETMQAFIGADSPGG